jgi:hypothetical protein
MIDASIADTWPIEPAGRFRRGGARGASACKETPEPGGIVEQ